MTNNKLSNSNPDSSKNQMLHLEIVDRFSQVPIVYQAWSQANLWYGKLKSTQGIVGNTIQQAERTVQSVAQQYGSTVFDHLKQPIHLADSIACQGFDKIQPIVTNQLVNSSKARENVEKYYSETKVKVDFYRKQAVGKLSSATDTLADSVDKTLQMVESSLDHFLPSIETNKIDENDSSKKEKNGVNSKQNNPSTLNRIIRRSGNFTKKLRHRLVSYTQQKWLPFLFESFFMTVINGPLMNRLLTLAMNNYSKPMNSLPPSNDSNSMVDSNLSSNKQQPSNEVSGQKVSSRVENSVPHKTKLEKDNEMTILEEPSNKTKKSKKNKQSNSMVNNAVADVVERPPPFQNNTTIETINPSTDL